MSLCDPYRAQSIEAARSGAQPPRHLDACPECRVFFETQISIQRTLAGVVTEPAPAGLESRLLAEFDAARRDRIRWWWPAAAAAAATVAAAALAIAPAVRTGSAAEQPFLQIPFTAPLAPYERTRIARMDVSVAALTAAGFDIHFTDTAATVPAEVLFGQDGRAHAIRLIKNRRTDQ